MQYVIKVNTATMPTQIKLIKVSRSKDQYGEVTYDPLSPKVEVPMVIAGNLAIGEVEESGYYSIYTESGGLWELQTEKNGMYISVDDAFSIDSAMTMKKVINMDGNRIVGLSASEQATEPVIYSQISNVVGSLAGINMSAKLPVIEEYTDYFRIYLNNITEVPGGFYLFYLVINSYENSVFTASSSGVTCSTGGDVQFYGSVANVVIVPKTTDLIGKRLHVACLYRNMTNYTGITLTAHRLISMPSLGDLIGTDPEINEAITPITSYQDGNYLIVKVPVVDGPVIYTCRVFYDDHEATEISTEGKEYSNMKGEFEIPVPLGSNASYAHILVRIVNIQGREHVCSVNHVSVKPKTTLFDEAFWDHAADIIVSRIATDKGDNIIRK